MLPDIDRVKGVPPGAVLSRELKDRGIGNSVFAKEIGEYPGIITDVIKLRRGITPALSIKLGQRFNVSEDYFMLLQACYLVEKKKKELRLKTQATPDPDVIKKHLFWDVRFENLDFVKRKRFIIERVFERGNEAEILEIIRFYGREECEKTIAGAKVLLFTAVENAVRYLNMDRSDIKCTRNSNGPPYRTPWLGS
jgi:plasmid maintenance system antidote protein VapI